MTDDLPTHARRALDRWYQGETDDPSEALMYAENLLGELVRVQALIVELRDVIEVRSIRASALGARAEVAEAELQRLTEDECDGREPDGHRLEGGRVIPTDR